MPQFYFDFLEGGVLGRDDDGCECRDLPHARKQALATLAAIAKDEFEKGGERDFQVSVRNDAGDVQLTADLKLCIAQSI